VPTIRPSAWLLFCGLIAAGGCRQAKPWQDPAWRPELPPKRIVAGSVLAAEVLLAIAPRERLAAVVETAVDPRWSTASALAEGVLRVGAEPEQLLSAHPDLVICDAFTRPETLALLGEAGVPVIVTDNPTSFDGIAANIRRIGAVCHLEAPAERLVAAMQEGLRALAARAAEVAAFGVICLDGQLHTHGRTSLFDAMVTAAGARNLAAEYGVAAFRRLDVETVLSWRPDVIVVGARDDAGEVVPTWLAAYPGINRLPCVRGSRVVGIPSPLLASTSHQLVEAAHRLQQQLLAWGRP
jgi:iron complex transport system substrate-binding protein